MIKRRNIAIILLFLLIVPSNAFAATYTYGYYGTTDWTWYNPGPLYANSTNGDAASWTDVSVDGPGQGVIIWDGDDGTGHLTEIGRNSFSSATTLTPPSGTIAFFLESTDGKEVYATLGHTTNPNSDTVLFTYSDGTPISTGTVPSGSTSSSGTSGTAGSSCTACQMFSCPGWSQYMSELQDIKNAIPPAPDWQQVADTFNNTITPSVISDLSNLLGSVQDPSVIPQPPDTPTMDTPTQPDPPAQPSPLDDGGITPPTGQEDPNLGSSTFTGDDIKNNAPTIQERQDPTGGFKILDPLANLPSQAEFQANKPTEGDNIAPDPKDTSSDQTTTTGPAPTDPTNTAPKPSANTDTTPITGPTPSTPTDNTTTTGPAPSQSTSTAPTPNADTSTAPTPGTDTSTAPVPGGSTSTAPTP